ncbi:phosphatase PAP2 family protein [Dietzia sp. SLG310A2-38A2]|uniref:phosphatase PAP2 family protein n=1 Tax=Dietzia sp. SLG310A2-38A2 TaxID=1630643 RepID=UPI0019D5149C|nr:phosphatase PAP2 family protein [Dietzia sp. SLG310A2-38A2]
MTADQDNPDSVTPQTPQATQTPTPLSRAILLAAAIWLAGLIPLTLLARTPDWSVRVYELAVTDSSVRWGDVLSEASVLLLVGLHASVGVHLLVSHLRARTPGWRPVVTYAAGGLSVIMALWLNLALKDAYSRVRPCHLHEVSSICPAPDNWSFPSSHTVIAFAITAALLAVRPLLAWVAVPLAVVGGSARVLAGDHYPHDVLAGALLGTTLCLGVIVLSALPSRRRDRA